MRVIAKNAQAVKFHAEHIFDEITKQVIPKIVADHVIRKMNMPNDKDIVQVKDSDGNMKITFNMPQTATEDC